MWPFKKKKVSNGKGVHDEVFRALRPWLDQHCRVAWRPMIGSMAGTGAGAGSFGGSPLLPPGEVWPRCQACERPLQHFLELNSTRLPAQSHSLGNGVFQFFYCDSCEGELEGWAAFSKAHLLRIVPLAGLKRAAPPPGFEPIRSQTIVGWDPIADMPHSEEHESVGLKLEYDLKRKKLSVVCPALSLSLTNLDMEACDEQGRQLAEAIGDCAVGDKLGGWPAWVQSQEYPTCPHCGELMEHRFQIDSECGLDYSFGDGGCGHITQCARHPEVMAFGWACY